MADSNVKVKYSVDTGDADKKIKSLQGSHDAWYKSLFSLQTLLTGAVAYAIGKMITDAQEAENTLKATDAVIKSTGGAAGVTAAQVKTLADKYADLTNFTDDQVQSAENMLLTFTKIGKETFPEATGVVVDMGAKFGNLETASVQVGKALQDPINGVTALKKVGVDLSDQVRDQIKVMVENGDTMGAQKLILKELKNEFGGTAEAMASPFTQMKNTLGEVSESLGRKLLPLAKDAAVGLKNLGMAFAAWVDKLNVGPIITETEILFIKWLTRVRVSFEIMKELIANPFKWSTYVVIFEEFGQNVVLFFKAMAATWHGSINAIGDFWKKMHKDSLAETKTLAERVEDIEKDGAAKVNKIRADSHEVKKSIDKKSLDDTKTTAEEGSKAMALSFDQIMKNHDLLVQKMKANNDWSLKKEIEMLTTLKKTHAKTRDDQLTVDKAIGALRVETSKEISAQIMQTYENEAALHKAMDDISTQAQIDNLNKVLLSTQLTVEDRKKAEQDLANLRIQKAMDAKEIGDLALSDEQRWAQKREDLYRRGYTLQREMSDTVLAGARKAGDERISLEKAVGNAVLGVFKKLIIAQVDAMAEKWALEATTNIVKSYGFDVAAWAELAAAAAATAAIRSTMNDIQMADDGIVMPTPGGTQATIGEAGSAEAVIPLDSKMGREMMGGGGSNKVIILAPDGITTLAKGVYSETTRLIRSGQIQERR